MFMGTDRPHVLRQAIHCCRNFGTVSQATDTARQAADKAATGASRASFVAFIGLLLGAITAALGGQVGARRVKEVAPA
jgi:hypothetical protein